MKIKYLEHKHIDKKKWDNTILKSSNSLVYGMSWYLDSVAPNWGALLTEDYEYVLPIPIKSKFGLKYSVQPELTQQLAIFSELPIHQDIKAKFIKKLPTLSYELALSNTLNKTKSITRPNYILNLDTNYNAIKKNYSKNTSRNLKKSSKHDLQITTDKDIDGFINSYENIERNYKACSIDIMYKLISKGIAEQVFQLIYVLNDKQEKIAWACIAKFQKQITYLIPFSNDEGLKKSAMFYLIDHLIKENAGKAKVLDFEGSIIKGVARFYRGFGAKNHPYYVIKRFRPSFLIGRI